MKNLKLHTPTGLQDHLPQAFLQKRTVERQIETIFERYGYSFISTPTLEYLAVFEGKGGISTSEIYKLADKNGDILALRPDMTPAVARMVATHDLVKSPLRVCYTEKIFRDNERFLGRVNELTQAGAELMGLSSPKADAEIIALAVEAFLAVGLSNFRVDIGQVDFLPGVLSELKTALSEEECLAFIDHMIRRNYVAAEEIAVKAKHIIPVGSLLSNLTQLAGGLDVLTRTRNMLKDQQALAALSHLEKIYEILQKKNYEKYIFLDLCMTGQLDYYTGVIFKGYAKGSATTVVDGGRYDQMLAAFSGGKTIPAVGFGIKIDRVLEALKVQGVASEKSNASKASNESGELKC